MMIIYTKGEAKNMNIGYMQAWAMGAFGSLLGGMVTAYYLGDDTTRNKILFVAPFLIVGVIGTFKALSYVDTDMRLKKQNL